MGTNEYNKLAEKAKSLIREKKDSYWRQREKKMVLELFRSAANRVPAYKDFLRKHKINPNSIQTIKDFQLLPPIDKENYLKKYPLDKLAWDGELRKPLIFTSTSGSTGEPVYFARNHKIDWQSSVIHELFLENSKINRKEPTLVIVCFSMGVWIGGLITYQAFEIVGERGYPLSILTPGINKEEIFKALERISPEFKQTVLAGYPPFIKDIIDGAPERGINLKKLNIKLLFAAEPFTEKFRDYVSRKVRIKNVLQDTMNIYGSADIGTMAFETPLSILARKITFGKPKVYQDIFSSINKTPTLAQYIPSFISFEEEHGEILLTGDNAIPLVRYAIGDNGGVFSYRQISQLFSSHGIDLQREAKKMKISDKTYQLPFVYIYERKDMSTTLYGLQIYPETIREVLLESPFNKVLTGKLTLISKFDKNQDQYLEINLETQKSRKVSRVFENQLLNEIAKNLRLKNSEYRELSDFLRSRALPKLVFWPPEDPLYFKPGIKQSWVKKR